MIVRSRLSSEWSDVAGRRARLSASAALLACWLGGCSISMPIPGFTDNEPTGTIKGKPAPNPFDPRDWPLVEPALRTAMVAEATTEPAPWRNPDTGRHGQLLPVASPFKRDGASCRAFLARIEGPDGDHSLQAVGCARDAGPVAVSDTAPWKGL